MNMCSLEDQGLRLWSWGKITIELQTQDPYPLSDESELAVTNEGDSELQTQNHQPLPESWYWELKMMGILHKKRNDPNQIFQLISIYFNLTLFPQTTAFVFLPRPTWA